MNTTINQSTETFNTMHKLEQAGMSRTQAEVTARAIDRQVSMSMQEVLDKIDARFDAHEAFYEARFQSLENRIDAVENHVVAVENHVAAVENHVAAVENRIDAVEKHIDAIKKHISVVEKHIGIVEKRLSWLYIESIVSICVMGVGFTGVIIALLRMG